MENNEKERQGWPTLDEAVLAFLGDEEKTEKSVSPYIQKNMPVKWTNLLKSGLRQQKLND